ncbi:MAG TPA: hypothetical protein DF613_17085 [Lachnospiraceae bacterium]|nr:hypothetical protein [Lachnospiraceae bacterium]
MLRRRGAEGGKTVFSMDGPLWRALNFIADVVILHFLWLFCSLPLVSIGASTTALYYAMMKRIRTNEGHVTSNFWQSFKANFRQATIFWLIVAAVAAVLWVDFNFCFTWGGTMGHIMLAGCSLLLVPCWMVLLYLFPVLSKFEGSIYTIFKNSFLMSIRHLPLTLLLTVIWATVWLMLAIFPPFTGLMLVCGAGLLAWVTSYIYIQIFRTYLPDEAEEDRKRTDNQYLHKD